MELDPKKVCDRIDAVVGVLGVVQVATLEEVAALIAARHLLAEQSTSLRDQAKVSVARPEWLEPSVN